ncbi:hypothetical protein [Aeoliella sp. SH292]|uniref:hypothetical protein n=1 Tax=Aeoliella sp. SH292 TaxID=3454464 RepID=UPI003F96499E
MNAFRASLVSSSMTARLVCAMLLSAGIARAEECCEQPSWVFSPSTFSHDPESGARVAQYERHAWVDELPDPRIVTSGYRTSRTHLPGAAGSSDTFYEVQNWANGNGQLDAEWERMHDAWQDSYLTGSFYQGSMNTQGPWQQGPWQPGPWQPGPWNGPWQQGPWQQGPWNNGPWQQGPQQGPWNNGPWQGGQGPQGPWQGGPGQQGPWNGGPWNGGGPGFGQRPGGGTPQGPPMQGPAQPGSGYDYRQVPRP